MAYSSAAYDYDRVQRESLPVGTMRVKQPPELRVVESRRARERALASRTAVVFAMVLAIICAILYNNVTLTELTAQIEERQAVYEQMQNDYRRMQVELEGRVSLRSVEETAENRLGMSRMESYQVEYVDLVAGDRVLLAREQEPSMQQRLESVWNSLLEYLGA